METVHFTEVKNVSEKIDKLFDFEKEKLLNLFPFATVEHVGSTAVPGALSKGDLDINIRIEGDQFQEVVEKLKSLYEINQPDNWNDGFASFKDDARDLGIQVTVIGSTDDCFVGQRDYLRNHPGVVKEYNALKEGFEGKDMDEYRKEKAKFFGSLKF